MTGHEMLVGRYELREVLGLGGMAEVRDGWDTRLDRAVAIKLLHPTLRAQPDVRSRFEAEARSAAALSHPNIVAVHDYGEDDGRPFIVMERLPGRTLGDVIAQGPMSPAQVRSMLDEVLAALEVAHAAGVLHRDIKPGNILLSADANSLKVADFGIAKTGGAAHTMTGQIVGTLAYMSPERVTGAPASVADDLYAVGVMAYEALLARRAFPQDNPAAVARAIMDDPPPPVTAFRADVDPFLAGVIDRAMSRDPRRRFASATQMRAALAGDHGALTSGPAPVTPPMTRVLDAPLPPTAGVPPRRTRSPRTRALAGASAVLVAFAVAAVALAMDPFSSAPAQEPVSTSTTLAPPPPPPPPTTPPPAPSVAPVIEQPQGPPPKNEDKKPDKGPGHGKGNGNGKGNGKRE
ncbi:protein kinase [Mycolicibacterium litorale]|uniref:non-specific serine/threonine protein kinase n=1 Tax=Mycolicibacterium litorale TaxID=758802 RepID=A0A6S6PCN3_9MYCO|nr:serine/threonine-protein kinase [Mycolicibacterium litorale]BCI56185.1 protein kinase [Mycolicibacterium litorale]